MAADVQELLCSLLLALAHSVADNESLMTEGVVVGLSEGDLVHEARGYELKLLQLLQDPLKHLLFFCLWHILQGASASQGFSRFLERALWLV